MSLSDKKDLFELGRLLNIFKWLVIIYGIVTLFSFIIVIADKTPVPLFNSSGLQGFFSLFEYPIKLTTGFIALVVILLTTLRMEQTQKQIDVLDDNNRFNNFYKHRDEFEKAFKEFPLIKALLQYEQNHQKNRRIAIDKKSHLIGELIKSRAKVFYTEWYYRDHTRFSTNFNDSILKNIEKIENSLDDLPTIIKEDGRTELDFEKTTDENLNKIINEFPSNITDITTHFARIDKIEFLSTDKTVSDYGYFAKINLVYWGLLFFGQFMNNQGMDASKIYNFIAEYNAIRIEKEMYHI